MKRLLIIEVDCLLRDQCPLGLNAACKLTGSDENCPLPKIEGGNKRLLMAEVDPKWVWGVYTCPYASFHLNCHYPHLPYNYPPCGACSDDNCPLPQIEPDKEEET
jgi:hypothetical protein